MRKFSRVYGLGLALVAAAISGGCLTGEARHTFYISPAGTTWSVVETLVRSTEGDLAARLVEEQDYVLAARAGRHPVARALAAVGATRVSSSILRTERPFTVVTDGRFGDLAAAARGVLARAQLRGGATIERDGCRRTFRAWLDADQTSADSADEVSALAADAGAYRFVLTEGRFVEARGFTIVEDGAVAIPDEAAPDAEGVARVSLTWVEGWCNDGAA